ncbi:hypothetical protein EOM81_10235 [bacterium]|nr:hypothetical protein [bacterium]
MWEYNYTNELYHFGVLGMKWGKRKSQERAYRSKLRKTIQKNDTLTSDFRAGSDMKRMKYRNNPLAVRYVGNMAGVLVKKVIGDVFSGKINDYATMDRKKLLMEASSVAAKAAVKTKFKDLLSDSAAKNYDDAGNIKKGVNTKTFFTKQDLIETSVNTAVAVLPIANWALKTKYTSAIKEKEANRRKFESWGSRILSEKVSDTIWID